MEHGRVHQTLHDHDYFTAKIQLIKSENQNLGGNRYMTANMEKFEGRYRQFKGSPNAIKTARAAYATVGRFTTMQIAKFQHPIKTPIHTSVNKS